MRPLASVIAILILSSLAYAAFGPAQPTPSAAPTPTATPAPTPALKCSDLTIQRDRIRCRINLPEENELNYLPEECRARADKDACLATYQTVRSCFNLEALQRVACAKKVLSLADIAEEKAKCKDAACLDNLRGKVFDLVKFRIYNLEYKAQEMKGAGEYLVVDFIAAAEQKKIEFNSASLEQKKNIVKDVITLWQDFVSKAQVKK